MAEAQVNQICMSATAAALGGTVRRIMEQGLIEAKIGTMIPFRSIKIEYTNAAGAYGAPVANTGPVCEIPVWTQMCIDGVFGSILNPDFAFVWVEAKQLRGPLPGDTTPVKITDYIKAVTAVSAPIAHQQWPMPVMGLSPTMEIDNMANARATFAPQHTVMQQPQTFAPVPQQPTTLINQSNPFTF